MWEALKAVPQPLAGSVTKQVPRHTANPGPAPRPPAGRPGRTTPAAWLARPRRLEARARSERSAPARSSRSDCPQSSGNLPSLPPPAHACPPLPAKATQSAAQATGTTSSCKPAVCSNPAVLKGPGHRPFPFLIVPVLLISLPWDDSGCAQDSAPSSSSVCCRAHRPTVQLRASGLLSAWQVVCKALERRGAEGQ